MRAKRVVQPLTPGHASLPSTGIRLPLNSNLFTTMGNPRSLSMASLRPVDRGSPPAVRAGRKGLLEAVSRFSRPPEDRAILPVTASAFVRLIWPSRMP